LSKTTTVSGAFEIGRCRSQRLDALGVWDTGPCQAACQECRHSLGAAALLRRFSVETRQVGFETGTLTQYLTYGLSEAGFEVVCMEIKEAAIPVDSPIRPLVDVRVMIC
jgi:hypothetical protein